MDTLSPTRILIVLLLISGLAFGQTNAPTSNVTVDQNGKVKGPKVTDFTTGSTDLRVDGVNVVGGAGGGGGGSVPGGAPGDYQINNAGVLDGNANLRLESGQVKAVAPNFIFKDISDPTRQMNYSLAGVPTGVTETVIVPNHPNPVLVAPSLGSSGLFMTGIGGTGIIFTSTVDFSDLTGNVDLFSQTTMPSGKLLGRASSSTGPAEVINIGANLTLDPATGTLNAASGTTGITTIPVGASIYVDAINGSSGGLRGRLDRPFQTVAQAIAVATAGDVIYVGPGTFTENSGFTIPANVSLIGAGGSNTIIISNLSDTTHAVLRWGANSLVSDLTVQCTGANSAPIGICTADTATTGGLFIGVNTIGVIAGFKVDKTGTNSFTAVDCTTTSGTASGTVDSVNSNSGTNTVLIESCNFNSTGSGAGSSSPRGIVVGAGTVKVFNSQVNIASAGASGDNVGVRVTGGTAEIHGLVVTRDTTGLTNKYDLWQTGGALNKENVSRPDGAALATSGVITELSRYASRDKNLSDMASIPTSAVNLLGTPVQGNLKAGDGSTWNTLAVGADTFVLTADSSQTTGLKWAASTGGGGGASATKQDVGDTNATISGGVTVINLTTPLTASRVITLPPANTYGPLLPLVIWDPKAVESAAFQISVARAGSDTINGGSANVAVLGVNEAGGSVMLESDGVSKWTTVSKGGGSRMTGYIDGTNINSGWVLRANGAAFVGTQLNGADLLLSNVTTNDVNTTRHGFAPKGDGNAAHFLDGNGTYSTPGGSVSDTAFAATWNGATTTAQSANSIYDYMHLFTPNDDGKVNLLNTSTDGLVAVATGFVYTAAVNAPLDFNTGTGILSLLTGSDLSFTAQQTITLDNATNNGVSVPLRLYHTTSGSPSNGIATGIDFLTEATAGTFKTGDINFAWSNVATRNSIATIDLVNATAAVEAVRIFGSKAMGVGVTTDPGAGYVDALTGYKINGTPLAVSNLTGAPSGTVVGTSDTQTLTNKRINPRASGGCDETSSATSTPDSDNCDQWDITALAAADVFVAPSGTPVNAQNLIIRIKDNGTARALTFPTASSGQYRFSSDMAAPTTTIISKTMYLGFKWNAADSRWDNVAQLNNF